MPDAKLQVSSIKKVLLIDLNFMGDMLMSSSVIREMAKHGMTVDVLCYDFCEEMVGANKYVRWIYTTKRRFPLWQAIKARFRNYDLVMQLNTSLMTNLLLLVAGFGRLRLGLSFGWAGFPLNIRVSTQYRTARSGNRIRENLNLLERAFGWKCEDERMEFGI